MARNDAGSTLLGVQASVGGDDADRDAFIYKDADEPSAPAVPAMPVQPDAAIGASAPAAPAPPATTAGATGAHPSAAETPLEVTARSKRLDRRQASAEAVKVVELAPVKHESADLGEVLARTPGVGVRRTGGLGSDVRFSLNGLQDDQIRFFLDGVPLDLSGYSAGIANVPVNVISRVEIYSGVVPIRYGADALGGAVNLVAQERLHETMANLSYQVGSFGLHRLNGAGNYFHAGSGAFVRVDGFLDRARNDYWVDDVNIVSDDGQITEARLRRPHDAYQAASFGMEAGLVQKPWARRLSLRVFYSDYDKEIQSDLLMIIPYGAATFGRANAGAIARYENWFAGRWYLNTVAGYNYGRSHLFDVTTCVYDWRGRCGRARTFPGELEDYQGRNGADARIDRHVGFARLNLSFQPTPGHKLSASAAPTFSQQQGENRRILDPTVRDPLQARRSLLTLVSGLEYQIDQLGDRLQAIVFAKHYFQLFDVAPGGGVRWDIVEEKAQRAEKHALGAGLETRYRFTPWLLTKASYEWATRLPRLDELLGDTLLLDANVDLKPERSHNANLGLDANLRRTAAGDFRCGVTGFLREVSDMILLVVRERTQRYENLYDARSTGLEAHGGWSSPRALFSVDGNFTYQRFISTTKMGPFAPFEGKPLPHRPSLFANAEARFDLRDIFTDSDKISLIERTNWIGQFDRGWGDTGLREGKEKVQRQLVHALVLSYALRFPLGETVLALEGHNLSDARAYDFYGQQKPGRSFYAKVSINYQ